MTRYLLCAAVFVAASAQAPLVYPCGTANCTGIGIPDGGPVQIGAVLQVSKYATPDGGVTQVRVQPLTTGAPIAVLGNQSRTSSQPDVVIGGANARDGGQGPIINFVSGSTVLASMGATGALSSSGLVLAQDGGSATPLCEHGVIALVNGDAGVTFRRAFSSLPSCVCTRYGTTGNPCLISTAPTVSAVGFSAQSADTAFVGFNCCGDL